MMQLVAVVDADADCVEAVVWHVDLGDQLQGMSRQCGAWVLSRGQGLAALTRDYPVAATPNGLAALRAAGLEPVAVINLDDTRSVIAAEVDRLQRMFEALPVKRRKSLTPPAWPRVPLEVRSAEVEGTPPNVVIALRAARHLQHLAECWDSIETQRLMREYLVEADTADRRPLPMSVARSSAV